VSTESNPFGVVYNPPSKGAVGSICLTVILDKNSIERSKKLTEIGNSVVKSLDNLVSKTESEKGSFRIILGGVHTKKVGLYNPETMNISDIYNTAVKIVASNLKTCGVNFMAKKL
jgi:hypothetical protein